MSFLKRAKKPTSHPNKLVQKHESLLVDKYLKRNVKNIKSTLKNTNKYYSEKIRSKFYF